MSTTPSEVPYPALCPWLSSTPFGQSVRFTVEHNGVKRDFNMSNHDVVHHFASVITEALTIKQELVIAEAVFKALNE